MHRHGTRGATASAETQPHRTGRTAAGQAPNRFQRSPTQATQAKITKKKSGKTGKGKKNGKKKAPVFQPVVFDKPAAVRCVVCKELACYACDHDNSMSKAAPFCVACEEAAQRVIEIHEANRKAEATAKEAAKAAPTPDPTNAPSPTTAPPTTPSPPHLSCRRRRRK